MPRDFKNFIKDQPSDNHHTSSTPNNYEDIINKYKNMDSNELTKNLFAEATKLKNKGMLDASTLNNLRNTLSPFLNPDQKNMLNSLIDSLNET